MSTLYGSTIVVRPETPAFLSERASAFTCKEMGRDVFRRAIERDRPLTQQSTIEESALGKKVLHSTRVWLRRALGAAMRPAEDPIAREQAAVANQKIDSHEDRCSERWREARDEMKDLRQRIFETRVVMEQGHRRLTGWIIGGQGSVILLLVGFLLSKSL